MLNKRRGIKISPSFLSVYKPKPKINMDKFKVAQNEKLGVGGIKCSCCNNKARKGKGGVDKKLNRIARAKVKVDAQKEIKGEL